MVKSSRAVGHKTRMADFRVVATVQTNYKQPVFAVGNDWDNTVISQLHIHRKPLWWSHTKSQSRQT